jgi:hypothetical protein
VVIRRAVLSQYARRIQHQSVILLHPSARHVVNSKNYRRDCNCQVRVAVLRSSRPSPDAVLFRSIRDDVAARVQSMKTQFPRFHPQLAIVQAGARPDSSVYVRMKAKAAEEVGVKFKHVQLPENATVDDVVQHVKTLNEDDTVSGILVQLPLGPHVNADGERTVTEAVSPEKDVDG